MASLSSRSMSLLERLHLPVTALRSSRRSPWHGSCRLWLAPRSLATSPKYGDGVTCSASFRCLLRSLLCPSPTFYVPCRLPKDSAPLSLRCSRVTPVWLESVSWRSSSRARLPRDSRSSRSSPSARASRSGHCLDSSRTARSDRTGVCRRQSSRGWAQWLPRWVSQL